MGCCWSTEDSHVQVTETSHILRHPYPYKTIQDDVCSTLFVDNNITGTSKVQRITSVEDSWPQDVLGENDCQESFGVGLKFSDEARFCSPYLFHSSGIHQSKAECVSSNLTDTFQIVISATSDEDVSAFRAKHVGSLATHDRSRPSAFLPSTVDEPVSVAADTMPVEADSSTGILLDTWINDSLLLNLEFDTDSAQSLCIQPISNSEPVSALARGPNSTVFIEAKTIEAQDFAEEIELKREDSLVSQLQPTNMSRKSSASVAGLPTYISCSENVSEPVEYSAYGDYITPSMQNTETNDAVIFLTHLQPSVQSTKVHTSTTIEGNTTLGDWSCGLHEVSTGQIKSHTTGNKSESPIGNLGQTLIWQQSSESLLSQQLNESPPSQQLSESPLPQQTSESLLSEQSSESPLSKQSSESQMSQESSESPLSKQSSESQMSQQSSESPLSQHSSESPLPQQSGESPLSQQSSESPLSQQSSESPLLQQLSESPLSQQSSESQLSKRSSESPLSVDFFDSDKQPSEYVPQNATDAWELLTPSRSSTEPFEPHLASSVFKEELKHK